MAFGSPGTWAHGPTDPAVIESYGQGCTGSQGVLALDPLPWAGPWLGESLEVDFVNQPPGFGLFTWGFSETGWSGLPLPISLVALNLPSVPGCDLLVSPDINEFIFPGTTRYVSFPLPNASFALGVTLRGQAGFFDAGLPGTPVVTSDALRMTFGAK